MTIIKIVLLEMNHAQNTAGKTSEVLKTSEVCHRKLHPKPWVNPNFKFI